MNRNQRRRRTALERAAAATPPIPERPLWPQARRFNLGLLTVLSAILFREVFLHADQMLWGSDLVRLHSTAKAVQYQSFWEHGRFPLWDPTILCGRSIVGDPVSGVLNPLAWVFWVSRSPAMFGIYLWLYVTAGTWGTWMWMRSKGAEPVGALVAAVAFAFSGKTAAHIFAGHMELVPGMLCAPWVLWAAERILQRRSLGSAIVLGAVVCITATMGSVQLLYWHVLVAGGYITIHAVLHGMQEGWARAIRPLGLSVLAGLVFLLGGMAWWLPVVRQTLILSARAGEAGGGFEFATMGSATPSDLLRMLWPFNGMALPVPFASDPENGFFWETASYPGLVALTLAGLLVLAAPKNRRTVIFGLLVVVSLVLALGRNTSVYRVAYEVIPGFSLFRVPARLLFYSNLFVAGMAGFGMAELLRGTARMRWLFVAVLGVLLMVAMGGSPSHDPSALNSAEGSKLSILIVLSLLIVAVLFSLRKISAQVFAALILAVSLFDLGVVWAAHLYTTKPTDAFRSNSVVEFLQARQAEEHSRFFDPTQTVPQQLAAQHGLETITGYHPGIYQHQLELYQALWESGDGSDLLQLLMHSPMDIACTPILDLMNVRYVVAYEPALDDRFEKVFTTPRGEFPTPRNVYERKDPLPRAFVVPRSLPPPADAESAHALCQANPRAACIIDGGPSNGEAAFQSLVPTSQEPGRLELAFETQAPGVVVVSESWHPDWVATDNGGPIDVHRANHGFLGIPIGAGTHAVHLWYFPRDFYLGCAVAGIFWLSLGGVGLLKLTNVRRGTAAAIG